MEFLADLARKCGASKEVQNSIKKANTARHVFEIINENNISNYFNTVCLEAHKQLGKYSDNKFEIEVIMFDFDGKVIGVFPESNKYLKT